MRTRGNANNSRRFGYERSAKRGSMKDAPANWRRVEESIRRYFVRRQEGCMVPERYPPSNDLAIIVPEVRFDNPTGGYVEINLTELARWVADRR
jgi:hypothetical protein